MFGKSRPALRHFAVGERLATLRVGKVWKAHDRRDSASPKFLVVPNKAKPWPILHERLSNYQPSPARLRNGKVALLLSTGQLEEIKNAIRKGQHDAKNPLSSWQGFSIGKSIRVRKGLVVATFALVLCLVVALVPISNVAWQPVEKPVLQSDKPVAKCAGEVSLGLELPIGIRKRSKVALGGETFTVNSIKSFGGLAQVRIRRACDGKYFRLDAWQNSDYFEVSKVY